MTSQAPIHIEALVDASERGAIMAAAQQLSEALGQASEGPPWPVTLAIGAPGTLPTGVGPTPSAVIVSLVSGAERTDSPMSKTEEFWRAYLRRLSDYGAPIFLQTVFRHVSDRLRDGRTSPVLERIRRLNRMAADLSQEMGIAVIDVDRVFAHIGARRLQSDHRTMSVFAADVAGHLTARSLLSFGLDDRVDPGLQERAKAVLGELEQPDNLVLRRMSRLRRSAQPALTTDRRS